jgi:hypothetical protein
MIIIAHPYMGDFLLEIIAGLEIFANHLTDKFETRPITGLPRSFLLIHPIFTSTFDAIYFIYLFFR